MSHIASTIEPSPSAIAKCRRIINAATRTRLRSQARTGPVEGKAWGVTHALYATLGPMFMRDAVLVAEHRLGIKDVANVTKTNKKTGKTYTRSPSVPTIKEADLMTAFRMYEGRVPVELDTKGGMSSTRKRKRLGDELREEEDVVDEANATKEKLRRIKAKIAARKEAAEAKEVAAAENSE